jgi:hypothetical protein
MKQSMQVLTSSETAEWYTPLRYIEAVREVLGGIDLDPASNRFANKWIGAKRIFTVEDNGLAQDWVADTAFLNPPYGVIYGAGGCRSNQEIWADKLAREHKSGNIKRAILLTKAVPGYIWWEHLFRHWTVCFVQERISFWQMDEYGRIVNEGKSKAASSFWYFGPQRDLFRDVFSRFGRVIYPDHNMAR